METKSASGRQPRSAAKKTYEKPAFRHERVFETTAMACGKISATQRQCGIRKFS
jgi:hypothetical protein